MSIRIPFPTVPQGLMQAMMGVESYINSHDFPVRLLELIRLRVSQINQCAFCIDMHFQEAIAAGESPQRLYSVAVWRDTPFYDQREQALLAWAEHITQTTVSTDPDTLFNALMEHYSADEVANMTGAIIQINNWNRLAKSFGFEAGSYQQYLK